MYAQLTSDSTLYQLSQHYHYAKCPPHSKHCTIVPFVPDTHGAEGIEEEDGEEPEGVEDVGVLLFMSFSTMSGRLLGHLDIKLQEDTRGSLAASNVELSREKWGVV